MSLANNMEGKFPSKILVFVTAITHNYDSFPCWSQIFHILLSICEGFILLSKIRFFERAFWVRKKFLVANTHFFCSVLPKNFGDCLPRLENILSNKSIGNSCCMLIFVIVVIVFLCYFWCVFFGCFVL